MPQPHHTSVMSPSSSPLTDLTRSPSPLLPSTVLVSALAAKHYPTPNSCESTQTSGAASPMLKRRHTSAESTTSADEPGAADGPPPLKKQKDTRGNPVPRPPRQPKVRITRRLNLSNASSGLDKDQEHLLETLLHALRYKKKIVVVAGAGISVSAGIPDFRSKKGLFALRGKELFDSSVYKHAESTRHFHDMVRSLHEMSKQARPTAFHHMIASIAAEGRLQRLYTQNVDDLETSMAPLATTVPLKPKAGKEFKDPWPRTVQLHGTLGIMRCTKCEYSAVLDPSLFTGAETPGCPRCKEDDDVRTAIAGKRSHGIGRLRPRMLLYHENGPDDHAIGDVSTFDIRSRPDAVIVVGTTLKVPGIRRIVKELCLGARSRRGGLTAWINLDGQGPQGADLKDSFDLIVEGRSDYIASLAALPRWDGVDTEHIQSGCLPASSADGLLREDQLEPSLPAPPVELGVVLRAKADVGGEAGLAPLHDSTSRAESKTAKAQQDTLGLFESSTVSAKSPKVEQRSEIHTTANPPARDVGPSSLPTKNNAANSRKSKSGAASKSRKPAAKPSRSRNSKSTAPSVVRTKNDICTVFKTTKAAVVISATKKPGNRTPLPTARRVSSPLSRPSPGSSLL